MTESVKVRALPGKRYVVRVTKPAKVAVRRRRRFSASRPRTDADARWSPPRWHPMDLASSIQRTGRPGATAANDQANRFVEMRLESQPTATPAQQEEIRRLMLRSAAGSEDPARYLYSNRPAYGTCVPLGQTPETSSYNLVATMTRLPSQGVPESVERPRWTRGVQHNAPWCAGMRSPAEQLASWDEQEPERTDPTWRDWRATRDEIARLQLEKFDGATAARAQKDLVVRPVGLTPGRWAPSFIGGQVYTNWDLEDTANYRVTPSDYHLGAGGGPQYLPVGDGMQSDLYAHLAPRRHRYSFRYTSLYLNFVMFAPPILSAELVTGVYADRLPFDFSHVSTQGTQANDFAVSQWMRFSQRLQLSFNQDIASQVVSLYFVKILVGRVDALYTIRYGNEEVGDLAAVLDFKRGARTDRYNVFRRTPVNHGFEVLDYGSLYAEGVTPLLPGLRAIYYPYEYGPI